MKSLVVILTLGVVSYALSDVQSSDWLHGLLFPFLMFISILALIFWLAGHVLASGHTGGGGDSSGGSDGWFGGGCDSDSGDGGCGGGDGGGD